MPGRKSMMWDFFRWVHLTQEIMTSKMSLASVANEPFPFCVIRTRLRKNQIGISRAGLVR